MPRFVPAVLIAALALFPWQKATGEQTARIQLGPEPVAVEPTAPVPDSMLSIRTNETAQGPADIEGPVASISRWVQDPSVASVAFNPFSAVESPTRQYWYDAPVASSTPPSPSASEQLWLAAPFRV